MPKHKNFNPSRTLIILFALFIIAGTVLLMLPVSTVEPIGFIDALFTATSAVCVTGLTVKETGVFFTGFGQGVILLLIQLGALGYMALASMLVLLLKRGVNIKGRLLVQKVSGKKNISVSVFLAKVAGIILFFELAGTLILTWRMRGMFTSLSETVYNAAFHSISAFCNAGFDLFGSSLTPLREDPVSVILFSMLIITGGIGYIVIDDLTGFAKSRLKGKKYRLSVHSRIVLNLTVILLAAGTILFFLFERNNPRTISGMPLARQVLISFFQATTPRTAGFNMVPTAGLVNFTTLFTIVLMFIGASPGGTAGGVKTTTVSVIYGKVKSVLSDQQDINMFKRRIKEKTAGNSVAVFMLSLIFVVFITLFLSAVEGFSVKELMFEVISAFGTVGLSTGITDSLSKTGRILIILIMFCGRLGPVTVGAAFLRRKKKKNYRYPEQEIAIG